MDLFRNKYDASALMIEISKCKDPVVFLGLAKLMGVDAIDKNDEAIAFSDIFEGIVRRFDMLDRKKRKEILKMFREANKEVRDDGNTTEDSNS